MLLKSEKKVVIPALDEAASIADVVTRVLALGGADVMMIDDGSSDDQRGTLAGNTRKQIEEKTGKPIVTSQKAKRLKGKNVL